VSWLYTGSWSDDIPLTLTPQSKPRVLKGPNVTSAVTFCEWASTKRLVLCYSVSMIRPSDIPKFIQSSGYAVDVEWKRLESWLAENDKPAGTLSMDPDFQRFHVWTKDQQSAYIEFCLRGGRSGRDIYWNMPSWHVGQGGRMELIDGKQRIEAVRAFHRNELLVFGAPYSEFDPLTMRFFLSSFKMHVNDLRTRAEVLQWYLEMNSGGTPHTEDEINRVRGLLEKEKSCAKG
jgi:hypothetical protein